MFPHCIYVLFINKKQRNLLAVVANSPRPQKAEEVHGAVLAWNNCIKTESFTLIPFISGRQCSKKISPYISHDPYTDLFILLNLLNAKCDLDIALSFFASDPVSLDRNLT